MHLPISSTTTNQLLISFPSRIAADKNGVTVNGGVRIIYLHAIYGKKRWMCLIHKTRMA